MVECFVIRQGYRFVVEKIPWNCCSDVVIDTMSIFKGLHGAHCFLPHQGNVLNQLQFVTGRKPRWWLCFQFHARVLHKRDQPAEICYNYLSYCRASDALFDKSKPASYCCYHIKKFGGLYVGQLTRGVAGSRRNLCLGFQRARKPFQMAVGNNPVLKSSV